MTGAEQANYANDVRSAEFDRKRTIALLVEIRDLLRELLAEVKK